MLQFWFDKNPMETQYKQQTEPAEARNIVHKNIPSGGRTLLSSLKKAMIGKSSIRNLYPWYHYYEIAQRKCVLSALSNWNSLNWVNASKVHTLCQPKLHQISFNFKLYFIFRIIAMMMDGNNTANIQ